MKKEMIVLWLDNQRDPEVWLAKKLTSDTHKNTLAFLQANVYPYYTPRFVWVKSVEEFQEYLLTHEMPGLVCFDHDLGPKGSPNGKDAATWFVAFCKERGVELPMCWVQSGNFRGAPQIREILGLKENEQH